MPLNRYYVNGTARFVVRADSAEEAVAAAKRRQTFITNRNYTLKLDLESIESDDHHPVPLDDAIKLDSQTVLV